jgi:Fe2+ transport system protein B
MRLRRPRRSRSASSLVGLKKAGFDFDRKLDELLTSRVFGFPLMLVMLAVVFWLTIAGSNVPSSMLATLLVDTVHPLLKGWPPRSPSPGGSTGSSSTGSISRRRGW